MTISEYPSVIPPSSSAEGQRGDQGAIDPERVLLFVPVDQPAGATVEALRREGIRPLTCESMAQVCERIGEGAAAAVFAEESCTQEAIECLRKVLAEQPAWSDFPMIVYGRSADDDGGERWHALRALGNVTFLDGPVRMRSLVATVNAAIRSRCRQYDARRAIEARDQFLAMLGHELRNPLGAIRFAVDVLQRDEDEAAVARSLEIVDRQSDHLTRLVDDLLEVARVTHGKITLKREAVDLVPVVCAAFMAAEPAGVERGLTMELDTRAAPSVMVLGDRARLEQILGNLLTNAIKYTPPGGQVTVALARDADAVTVRVVDTGIGMSADVLPRVFEVFAQADCTLQRAQGGMGLGLTVVRALARVHGGEVTARSEGPGRGSEFELRLPTLQTITAAGSAANVPRPVGAPDPSDEPPASGRSETRGTEGRRRVVLVEDSEDIRELMAELLREAGHEVIATSDGPEGFAKILEVHPDIAFVDIGLPGFDGFELARRVRATDSQVRLVALSGYGQKEDRARAKDAGFDEHLTKPVGLAQIEQAMESI